MDVLRRQPDGSWLIVIDDAVGTAYLGEPCLERFPDGSSPNHPFSSGVHIPALVVSGRLGAYRRGQPAQ